MMFMLCGVSIDASDEDSNMIASGECGDDLTWVLAADGTLTISGTGDMAYYEPYCAPWYSYSESINSVVIEEGVTTISDLIFWNCGSFTSISIPDSVTSIGDQAFAYCSALTSVEIPYGVTKIDEWAFSACFSLESITIPDSVTSIDVGGFRFCTSLESITIPESVTYIGVNAFLSCSSLKSIIIPANVTSIGENAFLNCSSLETVYVPEGLDVSSASIPEGASVIRYTYIVECGDNFILVLDSDGRFKYIGTCGDNLTWTLIDGTLTISGTGAMYDYDYERGPWWYCGETEIVNAVIEDGVTTIGAYAFSDCHSLESIEIPDSVASIGECAFQQCPSLGEIEIPGGVTSIGEGAFNSCESLTSITIPNSVKSIDDMVFHSCYNLETVYIPEGLDCILFLPPESAVIQYAVENDEVTITGITREYGDDTVPIPETLSGYEVVAVKEEYWDKVGEHTEKVGAATCTAKAFCSLCGKEYGEYGAHIVETILAVPATCTATGLTEGKQCSVCGEIITAQKEVAAKGHSWDEGVITTQPTASADGVKTYTCTVCGVTETEAVPATGEQSQPETPSKSQTPKHTPSASSAASEKEENVPSINGDNNKSGWQAISDEISGTAAGGTVTVDMNGATELPKNITEEIAGKDIDLVLDMGGGISWTINGLSVTNPKTVDLSVSSGTENIPVDVINRVSGENYTIQISLAYDGEFGFTARLSIDLGTKNDGLYANLFYYNDAEKLEFIDSSIIENGVASIDFTHASDYAIVIDSEPFGAYEDVSAAAGVLAGDDVISEGKAVPTAAVIIVSLISAAYALSGKARRRKR